jgi:catechol 2,3-dioxygenase-like lactoylglutathione lyase family enzyme
VAAVLLFSDDPAALARFYREELGVPLRPVNLPEVDPHWACDIRHVYFSIWPSTDAAAKTAEPNRGGAAFYVRDVPSEFERMRERGVEVVFAPRRSALGIIARFRDPDGNPFELYQPVPR